jgi:hypothetical protein
LQIKHAAARSRPVQHSAREVERRVAVRRRQQRQVKTGANAVEQDVRVRTPESGGPTSQS